MAKEKIIIGCDHAGLNLKNILVEYIKEKGFEVKDIGTFTEDSCDYPVIALEAAKYVASADYDKAVLVCGTGLGMSIMANKVRGVRAVTVSDTCSARMSRSHNDANVLCLGARILGDCLAKDITEIWLETEFSAGRHSKRVDMFENLVR